jgi:hypothetical protein
MTENNAQSEAGLASDLNRELEALTVGDSIEIMINGEFASRLRFCDADDLEYFLQQIDGEFRLIKSDNPDDLIEMVLVKKKLVKSYHVFALDETVCHDFGEPKGQCAVCGGYCKYD